jgi:hypothetical protein
VATAPSKGVSLAKGPAGIVGMVLLAYGVTALIFGGRSFTTQALDGTVNGKTWLGLEVNGWSDVLFIGSGALLLFGAPLHWGAKTLSLLVGLALGAAAAISFADGDDVLGIFAANGRTTLVWAIAAAVLIVLALLPRVGGGRRDVDTSADRDGRLQRNDVVSDGATTRGSVSSERERSRR